MRRTTVEFLAFAMLVAGGCCGNAAPPTSTSTPAVAPATRSDTAPGVGGAIGGGTFDGSTWGISLRYPSGWTPRQSKDYVLLLLPAEGLEEGRSLSLDVPALPPHIPGLIPLGLVKNGYLDDLKKLHGPLQIREESVDVPGANAVLVTSSWQRDGRSFVECAVLMTHGDHVYILRADSEAAGAKSARSALEFMVRSIKWDS